MTEENLSGDVSNSEDEIFSPHRFFESQDCIATQQFSQPKETDNVIVISDSDDEFNADEEPLQSQSNGESEIIVPNTPPASPVAKTTEQSSNIQLDSFLGKSSKGLKSFRLQAKKLFLTYPQCTMKPSYALQKAKAFFGSNLEWIIVASEKHKSGDLHLHMAICLKKKRRFNGSKLDEITGKHGDYRSMKHQYKCIKYVTKDGNYLAEGINVESFLEAGASKKSTKSTLVALKLQETNGDVDAVYEMDPGFFLLHKRKVEEMATWLRIKKLRNNLLPFEIITMKNNMSASDMEISAWLNKNMTMSPRPRKTKQLMIIGPTNTGKSTLVDHLSKYFSIYYMPREDFYDEYYDNRYNLCVFDEFAACKSIQWLNMWLEGTNMNLRKKGSQYLKMNNIPTIILSNLTLEEVYYNIATEKPQLIEALKARLTIVFVTQFIKVYE